MSRFGEVRKAVVALVGVCVAFGLFDEGVGQDLVALLTAALVFLVPNSPGPVTEFDGELDWDQV